MASNTKTVMEANLTGRVKWFDLERGYGFIKRDTNGADLFVHSSEVDCGFLSNEEEVRFDVGMGRKGPEAINVKTADGAISGRELRSVFRQLARLETLFGGGVGDDDDYGDSDDTFNYYMNYEDDENDSDLEDYLRNYEDSFLDDEDEDDDFDDIDDEDDDDDDYFDSDDDEERPDKFLGVEQLFQDPAEPINVPVNSQAVDEEVQVVCSLCEEDAFPVTFHPCGHKVCCLDCSVRLRKCPACKLAITKKQKWDGTAVDDKNAAKYTDLLNILKAQEESKLCQICMERKKNTVFGCGHFSCEGCSKILTSCHVCRQKINIRTKVFEI